MAGKLRSGNKVVGCGSVDGGAEQLLRAQVVRLVSMKRSVCGRSGKLYSAERMKEKQCKSLEMCCEEWFEAEIVIKAESRLEWQMGHHAFRAAR